jgi:hypothetical protein
MLFVRAIGDEIGTVTLTTILKASQAQMPYLFLGSAICSHTLYKNKGLKVLVYKLN